IARSASLPFCRPARPPPRSTLLPSTTLLRSRHLPQAYPMTARTPTSMPSKTIADLSRALAGGEISSVELTQDYLQRIARLNANRSEEPTSDRQSREDRVCRRLLEKKNEEPHS